jgi:hypothetical protein
MIINLEEKIIKGNLPKSDDNTKRVQLRGVKWGCPKLEKISPSTVLLRYKLAV